MDYSILNRNIFGVKIVIDVAVFLCNAYLIMLTFSSHGQSELFLRITSSLFVFTLSALFIRSLYKCTHHHEEFDSLTTDLASSKGRLASIEKKKTEIGSGFSEKIRTPLEVVHGYSSMILDGTFGPISEDIRVAVDTIFHRIEKISLATESLIAQMSSTIGATTATQGLPASAAQNKSWRTRVLALETLMVVTTIALLLQIFLASSAISLFFETIITILGILAGFFLANEIKNEPESESTVEGLSSELDGVLEKIELLEKEKSEFQSRAQVDLKEPVTAIKDEAHRLYEGTEDWISVEVKEAAGKIYEASGQLIDTISELTTALAAKTEIASK